MMSSFVIQTRQKADVLFPIPPAPEIISPTAGLIVSALPSSVVPSGVKPLAGNASKGFGPVEVDGYSEISVLVASDQPFTVTFFEGIIPAGPFPLTQIFVATASGSSFVVAQRFSPTGSFMKMTVANNSATPETALSLLVQGVPV